MACRPVYINPNLRPLFIVRSGRQPESGTAEVAADVFTGALLLDLAPVDDWRGNGAGQLTLSPPPR